MVAKIVAADAPAASHVRPDGGVLIVEPTWPPASSVSEIFLNQFEIAEVVALPVTASEKPRNLTLTGSPAA